MECEHSWQFMGAKCWSEFERHGITYYKVEHFFCSGCLERKEIEKREYGSEEPKWYKAALEGGGE